MTVSVPEPGQLVELRRRQWIVTDVQGSTIQNGSEPQNLVSVSSLDDDSADETLSAIWEIEPGARLLETAGLPSVDGWDTAEHMETFLDAVRWGATTHADRTLLQAPFRSGVDIEDYQLDPLVRAIEMARVNLLIADDVGLGKTIEAGLVLQELLIRHRARTVMVVCPSSLQLKWQNEMLEKFGLEFKVVDTNYIRALRRERGIFANPWTSFPRLITSMDWMKSGEGLRLIKDILPPHVTYPRKFDVLVVDEAHNVAPAGASRYAMPSQRTKLIRLLAPHFEHRIFMSATPHNGYKESFTALLELLDDQRFARGVLPDEKQLHAVMVRRLKTTLVDEHGEPLYPKRELLTLDVNHSKQERTAHELLQQYAESRLKNMKGKSNLGTEFILKLLKKRLFSSPRAFAITLAKHRQTVGSKKAASNNQLIDDRILHKAILRSEEEYSNDVELEEVQQEAIEAAGILSTPLDDLERRLLEELSQWAERGKHRPDSKSDAIIKWLEIHLKTDGVVNDKRVILFTEYLATHAWLAQILTASGWGGSLIASLHGGTNPDDRERVKAAFQANPRESELRILLATDAASEGIDLQNHCNYLIHIEIPWNPNVLEQRNGRIDRHGQREKSVRIWHPVGISSGETTSCDDEFLMRAVRKVEAIREDLGCVGPVIAKQIEEAMLGKRAALDTSETERQAAKARKFLVLERKLQERISRLHQKLIEARDSYHLTPDRIAKVVQVALELLGKPPLETVSFDGQQSSAVFRVPSLSGSWNQVTHGLAHPHTSIRRPITFDHDIARGRDDVVLVHLQHRLVQMALRLLRAEVWAQDDRKRLKRVAVRILPKGSGAVPIAVVWSRLLVSGGLHHRLHEELTLSGGELKENAFARIRSQGKLEELLESSVPIEPSSRLFTELQKRFRANQTALLSTVESRSGDRLEYLMNTLERRKKKEEDDLNSVLDELVKMIEHELTGEDMPIQLELWPSEQREQLRRDVEALRMRLERVPNEREKELAAIRRRYENPIARTFPVAVEFLVPEEFHFNG